MLRCLLILLVLSGCAETAALPDDTVTRYYRAVVENAPIPPVRDLRRSFAESVIVEPIGWTASGRPFANILSGELRSSRRFMARRGGEIEIEVIEILSTDLPEYFEFIGTPRIAFASIERNAVFLDRRRETEPLLFEEAVEHETQHVLDRRLFGKISPAMLEARAMLRGIERGRIPRVNVDRLYFAVENEEPHYKAAAFRLLQALSLTILGREDPGALRDQPDTAIVDAARALSTVIGL